MLHRANTEWPFLSFDILSDEKGFIKMDSYPYDLYFVSGTQTGQQDKNFIYITKMANLQKTYYDDDSVDMNSQDSNDQDPVITIEQIPVQSSINRIRSMNQEPIIATWNENG